MSAPKKQALYLSRDVGEFRQDALRIAGAAQTILNDYLAVNAAAGTAYGQATKVRIDTALDELRKLLREAPINDVSRCIEASRFEAVAARQDVRFQAFLGQVKGGN